MTAEQRVAPVAVNTETTQEIRLATTMSGGVSLAIWMGGVAREINLLCQASDLRRCPGQSPVFTGTGNAGFDSYLALINALDVTVDTDVLSGTSAGGINSVLLSYARVNDLDLGSLYDTWLNLGAMRDLLRDPTDASIPSLMYGDARIYQKLQDCLAGIGPGVPTTGPDPNGELKPAIKSTDLFVTTTLLSDEIRTYQDDFGQTIEAGDRRGVFKFDETQLGVDNRGDQGPADIRIRQALALAGRSTSSFPAAFEASFLPVNAATENSGQYLARPAMQPYSNFETDHWAADGGLLDNFPIDVLLETIFNRPARRQVRRVLAYVVPSAKMATPVPDQLTDPPGLVQSLLKDISAVKAQSIAAPVRAIIQHNLEVRAQADARAQLADLGNNLAQGATLVSHGTEAALARRQTLLSAQPTLIRGLHTTDDTTPQTAPSNTRDRNFDVGVAIVLDLLGAAYNLGVAGLPAITQGVHLARQASDDAKWSALGTQAIAVCNLLGTGDSDEDRIAAYILADGPPVTPDAVGNRLQSLAASQLAMLPADPVIDQSVEFVQITADIGSQLDPVRTTAATKLAGEKLSHFGAFYKRSWRANDWMWGRLDGVQWLLRILLDGRRVRQCAAAANAETASAWLLTQLQSLPVWETPGQAVIDELTAVLDSAPTSADVDYLGLPLTAAWLAELIQREVAAEEMVKLARAVCDPTDGTKPINDADAVSTSSAAWAGSVFAAATIGTAESSQIGDVIRDQSQVAGLLAQCPVPQETFAEQAGTPLMLGTASKAAATLVGALETIPGAPKVMRSPLTFLRTTTLDGYRLVKAVGGKARYVVMIGLALLAVGIVFSLLHTNVLGLTGAILAATGAYLLAFGAWGVSRKVLASVVAATLVLAIALLSVQWVRHELFGDGSVKNGKVDTGPVGRQIDSWLSSLRDKPFASLIVVVLVIVLITLLSLIAGSIRKLKPVADLGRFFEKNGATGWLGIALAVVVMGGLVVALVFAARAAGKPSSQHRGPCGLSAQQARRPGLAVLCGPGFGRSRGGFPGGGRTVLPTPGGFPTANPFQGSPS